MFSTRPPSPSRRTTPLSHRPAVRSATFPEYHGQHEMSYGVGGGGSGIQRSLTTVPGGRFGGGTSSSSSSFAPSVVSFSRTGTPVGVRRSASVVGGRSRTTSFDSFASASTIARRNTPVYVGSNGPLRTASPLAPTRPTLAQRISATIGQTLLETDPTSILLRHSPTLALSNLTTSLTQLTSTLTLLHTYIPSTSPLTPHSIHHLFSLVSHLTRFQTRLHELLRLSHEIILLARTTEEEEVRQRVIQCSCWVGEAEEGMRRSHVSVVEWCNELFKVQKALGEEAMRGGGGQDVPTALATLQSAKHALHSSALQPIFSLLNALSTKGVSLVTALHFRRALAEDEGHYFLPHEASEVIRVWTDVAETVERVARELEELKRGVERCLSGGGGGVGSNAGMRVGVGRRQSLVGDRGRAMSKGRV